MYYYFANQLFSPTDLQGLMKDRWVVDLVMTITKEADRDLMKIEEAKDMVMVVCNV